MAAAQAMTAMINQSPDPRNSINPGPFRVGNIRCLLRCEPAKAMPDDFFEFLRPAFQAEKTQQDARHIRRPRHGDFRIAPDDDRVGVMPHVAPPPRRGLAQHHERSHFIDDVVHPRRFEGGAMAALVPARVRAGTIKDAVNEKGRQTPPGSPEMPAQPAGEAQQPKPEQRVANRRAIPALHQGLQPLARNGTGIPFRRGQPMFLGKFAVAADQTVIAPRDGYGHMHPPGLMNPVPRSPGHLRFTRQQYSRPGR